MLINPSRRVLVNTSAIILAAVAAAAGLAPPAQALTPPEESVVISANACELNTDGESDETPRPYDKYGTNAWAECRNVHDQYEPYAFAHFQAYGEVLSTYDGVPNSRYSWATLRNLETGREYRVRADSSSGQVDRNLSFPEGDRIMIKACEGSSTDFDKYGCTSWRYATT